MKVLLGIASLGIILLGYLIMCRVDKFLERGGILDSPQGRANQGILVYGAPDVVKKIHKRGMSCRTLTTLTFPEDGLYSALFALSGDDCGNLAVCHAAKRADPGITIVARCSTPQMRDAFKAAGVHKVLDAGEPIDGLLAELWSVDK